jgi:hypothetical protein
MQLNRTTTTFQQKMKLHRWNLNNLKAKEELFQMEYLKDFCPGDLNNKVYARFYFACCAQLAYKKPNLTEKYFRQAGFTSINLLDYEGAQCYLLGNKDIAVIVFRGTEPKQKSDIWADLKTWKKKSQTKGSIHSGFMGETDKVWESVNKFVRDNKDKDLYIAGHSLGGAMASVASSRLQQHAPLKMTYTYGSPRVGNSSWRNYQTWSHQRIQNNNDVVTQTPPMLLGFRHHVPSVYINHYGNIRKLTRWQKTKDMFRGRWRAIQKFQFFDGIMDHNMDKYCLKLHKVWEREAYVHRSHISAIKREKLEGME